MASIVFETISRKKIDKTLEYKKQKQKEHQKNDSFNLITLILLYLIPYFPLTIISAQLTQPHKPQPKSGVVANKGK